MGNVYRGSSDGLIGINRFGGLGDSPAANADPARNDEGFKNLALAVIRQAMIDIGVPMEAGQGRRPKQTTGTGPHAEDARAFLTATDQAHERAPWLGWLNMADPEFQTMLRKDHSGGNANRVRRYLDGVTA